MNPLILFNTYKNIIIIVVFIALSLFAAVQSYRIKSYQADLATGNTQIITLSSAIDAQNKALSDMQIESIKRAEKGAKALNDAKVASLRQQDKILQLSKSLGKVQSCDQAVQTAKDNL